jgi:hypothetical protein
VEFGINNSSFFLLPSSLFDGEHVFILCPLRRNEEGRMKREE